MFLTTSGIFKSTCHIDVRWFPFDIQRCELKFGSWTYGGWSLDLKMLEADITGYIPNGEWDLVGKRDQWLVKCRGLIFKSASQMQIITHKRSQKHTQHRTDGKALGAFLFKNHRFSKLSPLRFDADLLYQFILLTENDNEL